MSIDRRLDALERLWGPDDPDQADQVAEQAARDAEAHVLYTELLATMDPRHVQRLVEYLRAEDAGERSTDQAPLGCSRSSRSWRGPGWRGLDNFALRLPGPVAEVYLQNRGHLFGQCRTCGLTLPFEGEYWRGNGTGSDRVPEQTWFERCPDCGGAELGCWDKWKGGPTMRTPAQKRAAAMNERN